MNSFVKRAGALILAVICLACLPSCGKDKTPDTSGEQEELKSLQFEYLEQYGKYAVVGIGNISEAEIVVPETYKGKEVFQISENAFAGKSEITHIRLPDTVKRIGNKAFSGCTSLKSLNIPSGLLTVLNKEIFEGCDALIKWNGGIGYIDDWVYTADKNIEEAVLKDDAVGIIEGAFSGCALLKSVKIGAKVSSIGFKSFSGCSALESLSVEGGNSVYSSVGNCVVDTEKTVIAGCKVSQIPSDGSVTSIGSFAFYGCDSITELKLPDGITEIGDSAFFGCKELKAVRLPSTLEKIGWGVFMNCASLETVKVDGGSEWNVTKGENSAVWKISSKDPAQFAKHLTEKYAQCRFERDTVK